MTRRDHAHTRSCAFRRRLPGLILVLAAAALYLATLDNGLRAAELQGGDLITHQYAQVQGRPSNAPGYPLYTMGGWLWFRLGRLLLGPTSNPIPILSSYSTLWALLALWLLYRLILEATDQGDGGVWPAALLASAFYGVTYFFWYYAVTTEQYTSAVAWTLAVLWLAFRWQRTRREHYLLAIALLCGVALAHMPTILFIIPPLLWFVLRQEPGLLRRPRLIAAALGLAVLPLLSYAYVYISGAQHPEWRGAGQWTSAWQWFWNFISTKQGRSELTWSWQPFLTRDFPALIVREMTLPGLVVGLIGVAWLERRRAIAVYATLAIYLVFGWIDRQGNWFQVLMPAYALLALGIGVATGRAWRRGRVGDVENVSKASAPDVRQLTERSGPAGRRAVVFVSLIALIGARAALSYPQANSANRPDDNGLAPGWAILADDPPPGTAVLGTITETLALNYVTEIWGARPDVRTITSDRARVALLHGDARLAVTAAALPLVPREIAPDAHYSALGRTLVSIAAAPAAAWPPPAGATGQDGPEGAALRSWRFDFGDGLRLAGGRATSAQGSGETTVLLAWEASARPATDWSVSVRLTQGTMEIAQADQANPVCGAYPTTRWSPGEVVGDAYAFTLPHGAHPDGLTVIVYRRAADGGFINLGVARFPLP